MKKADDVDNLETSKDVFDGVRNLGRRSALLAMGGMAAAVAACQAETPAQAQSDEKDSAPEEELKPDGPDKSRLTEKQWAGEPWVAEKQGNFDLSDERDNRLATLKMTNNLVGKKTYVPMFSRAILGPQGKGGAVAYGHMGFWTWQMQVASKEEFPDAPDGTLVQRAMYTGMILDPVTYEPTDSIYNAILDRNVTPVDSTFAESYLFYPKGGTNSVDRDNFIIDDPDEKKELKPTVRWGDQIATFLDGIFQMDGPFQPRVDNSIWTSNYNDIMDPKKPLVETDYNFGGLLFAWMRPWLGHGKDDRTQVLWNVKGTKMFDPDQFPELVRKHLVEKYPERV